MEEVEDWVFQVSWHTGDLLHSLAAQSGVSESEVLKRSLALYKYALTATKEGKEVGSARPGEPLETVITGF